jgi:ribosomal protein S21
MTVKVRDGDAQQALRVLRRKLQKSGRDRELARMEAYTKPSAQRRADHRRSLKRSMKEESKMEDDDLVPVRDAYVHRDRWKSFCPWCRTMHHYKALGRQSAKYPEPTPDTATGVMLRPAGPFSPAVEARYRREIISAARQ